eukprot:1395446-Pleurochrysis_carterae.AAC.1
MSPMDIMHGEPDGLLAEEGNCVVFSIVRIEKWCSLDDLNAAIFNYNWPAGHHPHQLHSSVLKGTRGTVPESGTSL